MASIKDVAAEARVSIATVSHVINRTRYVSPELIERVESVMRQLGYQPSISSKAYKTNRKRIVGFLLPDVSDSFHSQIITGAGRVFQEHGYGVFVYSTEQRSSQEDYYLKVLAEEKVDGAIIIPIGEEIKELKELEALNIPYVFVDRKVRSSNADTVLTDNTNGIYKAMNHLIKSGHERIGIVIGCENTYKSYEILSGYKKALSEYKLEFDTDLVIDTKSSIEKGIQAFEKLISLENGPTAIVGVDTKIALGILKGINSKGFECPKDISFVSFDDFEWADIFTPAITTVAHDPLRMGTKAGEILLDKINHCDQSFGEIIVPTELKMRKSTQVIGRGPFGEKAVSPDILELTESEIAEIKAGNYTAAISFHYSDTAWARLHEQGIRDCFNHLGIRILAITDAHFDPELQSKQHESILTMEPDILISIPTDEIKTIESYKKIVESKTKLVLINNVPQGLRHEDYVTCVSVNERENGQNAGRILGEYMNKTGKTKVGFIKHGAPFFATKQRDSAAEQVIKEEFTNLQIIAETAFINVNKVYERVMNLIKMHPEIEGLYVSWEGPALEVISALCELNREDIAIVTADLDTDVAINMAKGGMIKGLSSQRPYEQGRAMALAAANALLGKYVPPFIGVQPYYITPHNLVRSWQDIIKAKPPAKLINAMKENPNLSFDKQIKEDF